MCERPWTLWLAMTLLVSTVAAADDPKSAVTDPAQADDDFAFQGEFSGSAAVREGGQFQQRKVGLQVVAQGGGEFRGVLYEGGLPGSGWDREHKYQLSGHRTVDQLELIGDQFRVLVMPKSAKIASAERLFVAELRKVRRESPTLGQSPPENAIVVFDGEPTEYLKSPRVTEDSLLAEGCDILTTATDFTLHLEFKLPYMPYARGQGRSNSGVYIHSRYELQVLDSFGLDGVDNECGALYKYQAPLVNMCLPPLEWQTYDILFLAPRFDEDGNKIKNGRVTVHLNGVPVQQDFEFVRATGAGQRIGEGPNPLPIKLQNHGNPVRFRNVWMVVHKEPATSVAQK